MGKTSLNAAYGHGVRCGTIIGEHVRKRMRGEVSSLPEKSGKAPDWFPTMLHCFCWRQGFRNGAKRPTLLSTLTVMLIGE